MLVLCIVPLLEYVICTVLLVDAGSFGKCNWKGSLKGYIAELVVISEVK